MMGKIHETTEKTTTHNSNEIPNARIEYKRMILCVHRKMHRNVCLFLIFTFTLPKLNALKLKWTRHKWTWIERTKLAVTLTHTQTRINIHIYIYISLRPVICAAVGISCLSLEAIRNMCREESNKKVIKFDFCRICVGVVRAGLQPILKRIKCSDKSHTIVWFWVIHTALYRSSCVAQHFRLFI